MPSWFDYRLLKNPLVQDYREVQFTWPAGSSFPINLANGTVQKLPTSANATITLPQSVDGKSYMLGVFYGGTHTVTWVKTGTGLLRWSGGTTPTPTSTVSKVDWYTFYCDGIDTFGFTGGLNF